MMSRKLPPPPEVRWPRAALHTKPLDNRVGTAMSLRHLSLLSLLALSLFAAACGDDDSSGSGDTAATATATATASCDKASLPVKTSGQLTVAPSVSSPRMAGGAHPWARARSRLRPFPRRGRSASP